MASHSIGTFIRGTIIVTVAVLVGSSAQALDYPTRVVTIITGTVGGVTEPAFRFIFQKINERREIKYIFEAKPGVGGNIAADFVAKAKPDGYTLGLPSCSISVAPGVFKNLPFDPVKDLEPIALVGTVQLILTAIKSLPADNLVDLVKLAKANPGKYAYGSVGIGSINHLVGEQLKLKTGIDLLHVPYPGSGDAVRGMLSGDLALSILPPPAVLEQISSGFLKPIATLSPVRSPRLPNVLAAQESFPAMQGHECWIGIVAPAGTPKEIVDFLHDSIVEAMEDPAVAQSITNIGYQPVRPSVDQFRARIRDEVESYRAISKEANITVN